jgi:hypothetical protein
MIQIKIAGAGVRAVPRVIAGWVMRLSVTGECGRSPSTRVAHGVGHDLRHGLTCLSERSMFAGNDATNCVPMVFAAHIAVSMACSADD